MASPFEAVTRQRPDVKAATSASAAAASSRLHSSDSSAPSSSHAPSASTASAMMPPVVAPATGPGDLLPAYAPPPGTPQAHLGSAANAYLFGPGASGEFMNMLAMAGAQNTNNAAEALKNNIKVNPNVDPSYLASLLESTQLGHGGHGQPTSMPAPLMFTQPMMPTPTAGPGSMAPPPAVMANPALAALQDHDPMKRNRSSGLTNMMVVPDGKAQRTRSGQQPYGPMGAVQVHSAAAAIPAPPEPEITPEVKSHTARSLLRMLRAGTGVRTKNDISIVEAEKLVRQLGGDFAPVEVLKAKKRNAGREALSVLLTMYLQRPITIAEAARCFHNPTNRGLEPTDRLWELLGDKCWPPCPEDKPAEPPSPHPAALANARNVEAQRAAQARAVAAGRGSQARLGYHQAAMGMQQRLPPPMPPPRTTVTGTDNNSPFAAVVSTGPSSFRPQQGSMMAHSRQMPPQMPGNVPPVFNMGVGSVAPRPGMGAGPVPNAGMSMMGGIPPQLQPSYQAYQQQQQHQQQQLNFAAALSQAPPASQAMPQSQAAHNAASNMPNGSADDWSAGPFSAYAESAGRVPEHRSIRNIPVQTPGGSQAAGPAQAPSFEVSLSSLLSGGTLQQLTMASNNLHASEQAAVTSSQAQPASAAPPAVTQAQAQSQAPQASASPTMSGLFNELMAENSDLNREATLSGILGTNSIGSAGLLDPTLQHLAAAAKNGKSTSNGSGGMVHPPSLSSDLDFETWPELRSG
eukprot:jgi/Tetstr1/435495/TSEL_024400.t1